MSEEVIKSEYVYRGAVINVRLDQVRLTDDSDQRIVSREIVEHRGAVAIVALDSDDCVLLVRQYRSAARREMLEIPAGTMDAGEDPARCAVRELKEETGYSAADWEEIGEVFPSPGFCTEKMYLYLAKNLTGSAASPEYDEALELAVIPLSQAIEKIEQGEIVDAKSIIALTRVWKKGLG